MTNEVKQTVYMVKLTNSNEFFATVLPSHLDMIMFDNPMFAEGRLVNGGGTAIVINRYSPFLRTHQVSIRRDLVVFMEPISQEMADYYFLSLDYAIRNDYDLTDNVKSACSYMRRILATVDDQPAQPSFDGVLENIHNDGGTFH